MAKALAPLLHSSTNGYAFMTCVVHTETCWDSWFGFVASPSGASMASAFSDWYFARGGSRQVVDDSANAWAGHGNPTCDVSPGGWC